MVRVDLGGLCFRTRVANLSSAGDAVIMLHGFPQTSAAWEPLFTAAAAKGYRVIAIDQRGYSPGARPPGRKNYTIDKLIADVLGVADAFGLPRFHLVGHDWGAAVGWGVVMSAPERLLSWTALSIAHSYAFGEAVRSDPDQRRRSRYFLLFRMPLLPELLLGFNRLQVFRRVMYRWMPAGHVREYLRVFAEPGALCAILNWYRAVGRGGTSNLPAEINTPFLFLWGNRDPAAGRRAVDLQDQYIKGPYEKIELDAGHWLLERRTGIVVDAILGHLDRYSTRTD
jgi:pimeloyl-ACP methyl ester carboxylesterase